MKFPLKFKTDRPKLIDLFCKAGGCSKGYEQAGFEVFGVDIEPQKNYPFPFFQGDAIEFIRRFGHLFDACHASPPCQYYTKAAKQWRGAGKVYLDLIEITREALIASGKHYIIEGVPGSPLVNPIMLNGAKFNLLVARKRYFETSFLLPFELMPPDAKAIKMGRPVKPGDTIQPVGHFSGVTYAKEAMGIDWMTGDELSQAIPPACTEWIGKRLLMEMF